MLQPDATNNASSQIRISLEAKEIIGTSANLPLH